MSDLNAFEMFGNRDARDQFHGRMESYTPAKWTDRLGDAFAGVAERFGWDGRDAADIGRRHAGLAQALLPPLGAQASYTDMREGSNQITKATGIHDIPPGSHAKFWGGLAGIAGAAGPYAIPALRPRYNPDQTMLAHIERTVPKGEPPAIINKNSLPYAWHVSPQIGNVMGPVPQFKRQLEREGRDLSMGYNRQPPLNDLSRLSPDERRSMMRVVD